MRVDAPLGHPSRPLSAEDTAAKFRANARFAAVPLEQSWVETIIEEIMTLETIDDVAELVDLTASKHCARLGEPIHAPARSRI